MTPAVKNKSTSAKGFMPNLGGFNFKTKRVICSSNISKSDQDGIIRLYEALVPRKEMGKMNIKIIRKFFPTFEDINIEMIVEEAFPMFEKTIGIENFAKVKKFFGIGGKVNRKQNSNEIEILLSKMRSIENAQYYISGYKELVCKIAKLLEGGEQYTDIEKTKIIRMYAVMFLCAIYFIEDLSHDTQIDRVQLMSNNKYGFYPEELFILFVSRFLELPEENIFYDSIIFEFNQIRDKKILREILEFAELDYKDGRFFSATVANPYQNFAQVRKIKQKIHTEPVITPIELFGVKKFARQVDFADLYGIYKEITTHNLDYFNKVERDFERFEGSRVIQDKYFCYEIKPDQYISGEKEKARLINLFEIFAKKDLTLILDSDLKTGQEFSDKRKSKEYNIRQFLAAIKFVKDVNVGETTLIRDFEIANELIKRDRKRGILSDYFEGLISIEDVKTKLKIDKTFEFEFFGIKPKIDHIEVFVNFAIQNGYASSKDSITLELIENVLLPSNEELVEQYNSGEIGINKFEEKLGFNSNFAEMFFDISKIDINAIEAELLETKKSSVGKKKLPHNLKMLVLLYCYVVEGQINCGAKNRVPKRNKALKTSILKTLV